ncbi:uncharacterized protein LOC132273739 [Cornus florida]|uniref:uncharacterized protein LOC132273739 n=1 Tax=Cornus florida TaxID=4283 RepID=UPI00289E79C8|nr:uncharacterized protein LOC132273739 [Cornus florida]
MALTVGVAFAVRPTSTMLAHTRQRAKWVLNPLASSSYSVQTNSSSSSSPSRKLILYSKPGCCLCDGLKEKLLAAFSLSGPDSLHDVDLQVRDITTNPVWERAYQFEIPVLARVLSDGSEETLPRLSPRLGVELVQKKIAAALRQ